MPLDFLLWHRSTGSIRQSTRSTADLARKRKAIAYEETPTPSEYL